MFTLQTYKHCFIGSVPSSLESPKDNPSAPSSSEETMEYLEVGPPLNSGNHFNLSHVPPVSESPVSADSGVRRGSEGVGKTDQPPWPPQFSLSVQ